ncbi:MAG: hypothetical protein HY898_37060 [Deltaproteobacteria bacterium]|nr:hypothetical protein [Deltaproteobacteria bacterium]
MPLSQDRVPAAQDLHIHTTFSTGDGAIVPQQTVGLVASIGHARVVGISDHIEYVYGEAFPAYRDEVRAHGLRLGTEVTDYRMLDDALALDVDYYVFHCEHRAECYRGAEALLSTGKPVIIAHPLVLGTDLERVPPQCLIEINNRYVWRNDWRSRLGPYVSRFRFVLGSDAHQPHWLNQSIARHVADELGIEETLLFA